MRNVVFFRKFAQKPGVFEQLLRVAETCLGERDYGVARKFLAAYRDGKDLPPSVIAEDYGMAEHRIEHIRAHSFKRLRHHLRGSKTRVVLVCASG